VYSDGSIQTVLIASKIRVAPLKKQNISRLELLGALIVSRLAATIAGSLPEQVKSFFWTDSTAALHWICNEKPWNQYIEHRVIEIRQLTDLQQWHHCPGNHNPADIPSRGMNGAKLSKSELWWEGPTFLFQPENQWPNINFIPSNDITDAKLIKKPTLATHILVTSQSYEIPPFLVGTCRLCSKFYLLCCAALLKNFSHYAQIMLNIYSSVPILC